MKNNSLSQTNANGWVGGWGGWVGCTGTGGECTGLARFGMGAHVGHGGGEVSEEFVGRTFVLG